MNTLCTVPGCIRPFRALGLCATHWGRQRYRGGLLGGFPAYDKGTPTAQDRFWAKVDQSGNCWLWTGAAAKIGGYGQLRYNGRLHLAHRLSYEWNVGPIPPGIEVCHSCDIGACVRPDHLFLGTHHANMLDAAAKGLMSGNGNQRGENHGGAKLTTAIVLAIRASSESAMKLATEYGVAKSTICHIRSRKSWSCV